MTTKLSPKLAAIANGMSHVGLTDVHISLPYGGVLPFDALGISAHAKSTQVEPPPPAIADGTVWIRLDSQLARKLAADLLLMADRNDAKIAEEAAEKDGRYPEPTGIDRVIPTPRP